MNKTQKVMTGIITATLTVTAVGCGAESSQVEETKYEQLVEEEIKDIESKVESEDYSDDTCDEVELDHLASKYPNVDLEAIEDYLEESGCDYNEEELEDFIDDLNENGEPTRTTHSYGSTFPWWLFLMSNSRSHVSTPPKTVVPNKSTTQENSNSNTGTNPTVNSGVNTSPKFPTVTSPAPSKPSGGFGTGSTSSGS